MKLLFTLAILLAITVQSLCASDVQNLTVEQAVTVAEGGYFCPDELGPKNFNVIQQLISDHPYEADRILSKLMDRMIASPYFSSLFPNVLTLTYHRDHDGASQIAKRYQQALNNHLKDYDLSSNKDSFLQGKTEEDRNEFRRLLWNRDALIQLEQLTQEK